MKALKSKFAAEVLRSGVKIPLKDGAKFEYKDAEYTVKVVPKASFDGPDLVSTARDNGDGNPRSDPRPSGKKMQIKYLQTMLKWLLRPKNRLPEG